MKIKKILAIATAAAFAFTGTCYADTGANLATEGSDVTSVIEDISLSGERIEADETSYYTSDFSVNYSLYDETGISSVAILVNGETLAEKRYDTSNCIDTADGEVINAESLVETEGAAEAEVPASTAEPITTVSDSLVISPDALAEAANANTTAPAEEAAEPATEAVEPTVAAEGVEPAAESVEPTAAAEVTETTEAAPAEASAPAVAAEATEATEATDATAATETAEPAPAEEPINTYNAEMVVTDVNGQTETKEFEINTAPAETPAEEQEAVSELKAAGLNDVQVIDSTTFRVEVNLTCQAVTIYKKNLSGTYEPFKVAICSTGRSGDATPTGTFTTGPYGSKCGKSRWALLSGGSSYAQYLVRIHHGICFHSIPYKTRGDNSQMYRSQYNKLGTVASAGCVRLRAIDAKWIYDNCPNGTTVKVFKSSTASPLGMPTYTKLPSGSTLCWDPTDPDTGNPANGGNGRPTGIYIAYDNGVPVLKLDSDITNHTVNFSSARLTYNDKVQKPSVSIYGLTNGTNYTVSYPAGCKYVGTYTVTVRGIGSFEGSKTASFQIVPQSTKIKSLKRSGSKKFRVKYNKVKKQISGYQIIYSKSSKFSSGNKTVTVKGYKNTSRRIKTSSKGTYYVKVRVYKTVGKTTYYGNWSSAKKVKVK